MTIVTEAAKEKLRDIQKNSFDPNVSLRVKISQLTPNELNLIWDKEQEEDQVIKDDDGVNV